MEPEKGKENHPKAQGKLNPAKQHSLAFVADFFLKYGYRIIKAIEQKCIVRRDRYQSFEPKF